MAWLDDRAWCHPKLVELSHLAFRTYINGLAYSSGMSTQGRLTPSQQALICPQDGPQDGPQDANPLEVRAELVLAGLWDELPGSVIAVHDWDEHNGRRDARKAADRERKRVFRALEREKTSAGPAHVDCSDRVTELYTNRAEGSLARREATKPGDEDARARDAAPGRAAARRPGVEDEGGYGWS